MSLRCFNRAVMDDVESISSLLSFPSPPLVYLSAGITSTFGKLRRAPIDEAACRTFSTLDAYTGRVRYYAKSYGR